jgi:hypothetical protein
MNRYALVLVTSLAFWMPMAVAQTATPSGDPAAEPAPRPSQEQEGNLAVSGGSGFKRFVKDVGSDYRNTFSKETAIWYGAGLAAASLVHLADEDIREALTDPPDPTQAAFEGGDTYGNVACQLPLAVGWWAIGHAVGNARAADAGRDLLRAQINAASWTYALKFAVNRDRPNGDKRSFPSGHASASFATAMVLQQHYGWKLGVPFFAGATYTAVSRIGIDKHWTSDVVFGAVIGMASARTVTLRLRKHKINLVPVAVPGGGGVAVIPVE